MPSKKVKVKKVHRHKWEITDNECRNCGYYEYFICECGEERDADRDRKGNLKPAKK